MPAEEGREDSYLALPDQNAEAELDALGEEERYIEHECPYQTFLEDPITQYYGLGGDMDEWGPLLGPCPVCDAP